jgi:putative AlgH/UPF0301 family transcriptional regulator
MVPLFALALLQQPPVGRILVATEKSHDADLTKSVVLVIHSDSAGVMGLILNRPRGKSYFGGPIPLGQRALVRSAEAEKILPGVYLSATAKDPGARIYIGYVGWSPQQLADEISRGLWRTVRGEASTVFDPHPDTLWQRLRDHPSILNQLNLENDLNLVANRHSPRFKNRIVENPKLLAADLRLPADPDFHPPLRVLDRRRRTLQI